MKNITGGSKQIEGGVRFALRKPNLVHFDEMCKRAMKTKIRGIE